MSDMAELIRLAQRGRVAENRSKAIGKFFTKLAVLAIVLFSRGWAFMILLGILHGHFPVVPPLAFFPSFAIVALVRLALATGNSPTEDKKNGSS